MNTTFNPELLNNPSFDRQVELEQEMRTRGIQRFRARNEKTRANGTATEGQAVTRLVISAHDRMVAAVTEFIENAKKGAGRRHAALKYLERLDIDSLVNLTCRSILDNIGRQMTLTKGAIALGVLIENEVNARIFDDEMPKAYKKFIKKAQKETTDRRKWSHLLFPARLLGVELEEWDTRTHLLVGKVLIELFEASTKLIEVNLIQSANGSLMVIDTNAETLKWLEQEDSRLELLCPLLMPCIVPPKPWTTPFDGGYYTTIISRPTLVKTHNKQYLHELADREMPEVYAAVNALQETPWAINTRLLDVVTTLYKAGSQFAELPTDDDLDAPARPYWLPSGKDNRMKKEDMTPEQRDEFDNWRAEAHRVYVENASMRGRRAIFLRTLDVAQRFAGEEEIYFPHQLDWRGRAYPLPLYLTPQGNDLQRGLLEFANGVAITDQDGADWLAIHGAGCFGYDKVSLQDRVEWVIQHERQILAAAADPYDNRFWLDADKPWQFLAFCFDWAGYRAEGFDYVSSLPVQMDGTCNGLQNFSAMLLDEIGGAAVNLIPAETPQDIYQRVADLVKQRVALDTMSDDAGVALIANGWHGNITRKTTKRPVMTLAYGAKRFGFVGQVEEDTIKPWREKNPETYPFVGVGEDGKAYDFGYKAAMYMGGLIWECVGEVVVAARQAMDWLQEVSKASSKEGLPINWTTPAGFMVQQAYRVPNVKSVDTTFNSTRIQLSYQYGSGKIDSRRQASGISPNWVHSLDASHLMKTIVACHAEGVRSFSMIHDSYGTHAGNAWALARNLREQFVLMYSEVDTLARFKLELEQQIGVELMPLPPKGKLDLNVVLDSPFFFA